MGCWEIVGRTVSHLRAALYTFNISSSGTISVYCSLQVLNSPYGTPTHGTALVIRTRYSYLFLVDRNILQKVVILVMPPWGTIYFRQPTLHDALTVHYHRRGLPLLCCNHIDSAIHRHNTHGQVQDLTSRRGSNDGARHKRGYQPYFARR